MQTPLSQKDHHEANAVIIAPEEGLFAQQTDGWPPRSDSKRSKCSQYCFVYGYFEREISGGAEPRVTLITTKAKLQIVYVNKYATQWI